MQSVIKSISPLCVQNLAYLHARQVKNPVLGTHSHFNCALLLVQNILIFSDSHSAHLRSQTQQTDLATTDWYCLWHQKEQNKQPTCFFNTLYMWDLLNFMVDFEKKNQDRKRQLLLSSYTSFIFINRHMEWLYTDFYRGTKEQRCLLEDNLGQCFHFRL